MAELSGLSVKMVLPPDGRQTRIDFFSNQASKKVNSDWFHALSSWFRHDRPSEGPRLEFFEQQLEKEGYSEKTRKSYLFMMRRFFDYHETLSSSDITMAEIEDYNYEFFVSGRYSRSYQLQFINALRLYYQLTEGIELNLRTLRKSGLAR